MMRPGRMLAILLAALLTPLLCFAGGPLLVGGPAVGTRAAFGKDGQPFIWNPAAMPIQYRVDPGPLAATSSGTAVVSNATGLTRVAAMFDVWHAVPTASVSFNYAGPLLPAGSYAGGDLSTLQQFNDMIGACRTGTQNPVIFDADGKLMAALGLAPEVIGFNEPCSVDESTGYFKGSAVLLNGKAVNSCLVLAWQADGAVIVTNSGLGILNQPDPLQEAFADTGAAQCGYCVSGIIMAAKALLDTNPRPQCSHKEHWGCYNSEQQQRDRELYDQPGRRDLRNGRGDSRDLD